MFILSIDLYILVPKNLGASMYVYLNRHLNIEGPARMQHQYYHMCRWFVQANTCQ